MQQFKRFDVVTIAEGEKHPREQNGLQASSEQELRSLLAMTGEKIIEIRRVYEGDVVKDFRTNPEYNMDPSNIPAEFLQTPQRNINPVEQLELERKQAEMKSQQGNSQAQKIDQIQTQIPMSQMTSQQVHVKSQKPRFYTIGDIEIKEQDGLIYQKQWVKISSSDYRLVNDKTNKIVPMQGKHIEVKKWILVDNSDQEDATEPHQEIICG